MTSSLLLVILLGAAQSTGQMSPTSDVSSNRVRATGATHSRSNASRASDWTSPEDFGAWGDYIPSTAAGHDDTAALQAAFNSGKAVRLGKGRTYKATASLTVPNGTTIVGAGYRSSLIWGALSDTSTDLLVVGGGSAAGRAVQLLNFGIVGGSAPGRAAISGWSISSSTIDVYINGGWDYMLRVWRTAEGIDGPEGGGFEANRVTIEHANSDLSLLYCAGLGNAACSALTPNPKRGLYVRGWINGSKIWANIGTLTTGDGVHLEGTYGAANNGTVEGLYQGIAGWGVWVGGSAGNLIHILNTHCEVTGLGDIYVANVAGPVIGPNVIGAVTLSGTTDARILPGHSGALTVEATAQRTYVESGSADATPITDSSPTTMGVAYMNYYTTGAAYYGNTPRSPVSDVNLIVNGDFARFLSTTAGAANSVWGVSGFYTATKTGTGLADATRTTDSAFAAKFAYDPGNGRFAYFPIFDAAVLSTYAVGQVVTASFKWKSATPGVGALGATMVAGNAIGGSNGMTVDARSLPADNGFQRFTFSFKLTAAYIANGVGLQLAFVNSGGEPSYYISEVMAVAGVSAPQQFHRRDRDRAGAADVSPGGRLTTYGSAAPVSGGDPAFGSAWRPGDVVWNTAPVLGGPDGWVCVTGGSPGTWQTMSTVGGQLAGFGEYDMGTCTTSATLDPANGLAQKVTLGGDCTIAVAQPIRTSQWVTLKVTQGGSYSVTLAGAQWPGGVDPSFSVTSGYVDLVKCYLDGSVRCEASPNMRGGALAAYVAFDTPGCYASGSSINGTPITFTRASTATCAGVGTCAVNSACVTASGYQADGQLRIANPIASGSDWMVIADLTPSGRNWNAAGAHTAWSLGSPTGSANTARPSANGGTLFHTIWDNASDSLTSSYSLPATADLHRLAVGSDLSVYWDGVSVGGAPSGTGTGAITTMPGYIWVGSDSDGSYTFDGYIKNLKICRSSTLGAGGCN